MSRFQVRKNIRKVGSKAKCLALETLSIGHEGLRDKTIKPLHQTVKAVATVAITTTAIGMAGTSAMAFNVTQNNDSSTLLNALLGNTTGLSNFTVTTTGDPAAFGLFNNDPFGLGNGVVLSTGRAIDVVGPNNSGSTSTDLSGQDLAQIDISFNADTTANNLFFQYAFGSEEFLEFAGSQFNDSFELSLNGTNLALLSNGNSVTINNLAASPNGPFDPAFIQNTGNVTQLDGYTQVLTFTGALNQNATNTLSIRVRDVGDSIYDSAVFIQGQSVGTEPVPEPLTILGSLAAGSIGVALRRKYQKQKDSAKV